MMTTTYRTTTEADMKEILTNNERPSSEYGRFNFIDVNWEAKKDLRELMRKVNGWDEETQTVNIRYMWPREVDQSSIISAFSTFFSKKSYANNSNNIVNICDLFKYHYSDSIGELAKRIWDIFPDTNPKNKDRDRKYPSVRENSKTSKIVKKLLDIEYKGTKYDDGQRSSQYEADFAKYADSINPKMIERNMYISLNPNDYLLGSYGTGWSSCHTINAQDTESGYSGMHMAGNVSYAIDNCTIITYELSASYKENKPYMQKKVMRNHFFYEDGVLIQSRLYPQGNDGVNGAYVPFRTQVQKVIAEALGLENRWVKKGGSSICTSYIIEGNGAEYNDWMYYDTCNVSRIVGLIPEGEDDRKVHVAKRPICLVCGMEHDNKNNLNCNIHKYSAKAVCHDCGREIGPDDDYVEINGRYYCNDCTTTCTRCGQVIRMRYRYTSHTGRHYCRDCGRDMVMIDGELYARSSVRTCSRCGDYHLGSGSMCVGCQAEIEG